MAYRYQNIIIFLVVMLITILDIGTQTFVEGYRSNFGPKPMGTIKTIVVPEDGDVIDCVDIYKQPALSNPLIKDKNIQMKPSSNLIQAFRKPHNAMPNVIQNWQKYGECPKETVPITRTRNYNDTIHNIPRKNYISPHEYVQVDVDQSIYYGASAIFNVWNPRVTGRREFSLSQMWVISGTHSPNLSDLNTIEAGWMVHPQRYGDSKTRFFTFWTRDNYKKTRCYDYACKGFIQTNNKYRIGDIIDPTSVYNRQDQQVERLIAINRDRLTGHWWLTYQDIELGYFHRDIFTTLNSGAVQLSFGGEIINEREGGRHTETQMGSGHFSEKGHGKVSYIRNIEVVDRNYKLIDAKLKPNAVITNRRCYDFTLGRDKPSWKTYFYFGGPGYSPVCE